MVDEITLKQASSDFLRFFYSSISHHCLITVYHQHPTCSTPLTRQHIIIPSVLFLIHIWLAAVFQVHLQREGYKRKREVQGFDTLDVTVWR
jgi:hypothetical protein